MSYVFKIEIEAEARELIPPTLELIAKEMSERTYYVGQKRPNAVKYEWDLRPKMPGAGAVNKQEDRTE